ncbi:E3 ubiquitin-protein ligase trul-1-like [Calliphora vicina]|uniref:E3 ubiquitin-protein ligase trul-1-like n=1 Tax=Calliphora vicina TaxID=7373 RepID=UPI00325B646E
MQILNIVCPICTEVFKNADDIYSTSCGHIFHLSCMSDWQRRGTSCPQCRHYNPTTHKLYLSFDDAEESSEKLQEIELKLKSSNEKNAQLLDQMNETELNFLHIQEQYTTCEQARRDLEERIRQMFDSEDNFLHLQGQYTESSELVKELQDQIQVLSIENECKAKELRLKCLEIESLKAGLEPGQRTLTDSILSDKIRILEQKLKHISAEFEKEIKNSTQLSIEKMKLQSYVDHLKSVENTKENVQKQTCKENLVKNRPNQKNANVMKKLNTNKTSNQVNNDTANCVFIKALPLDQLTIPVENVIISLASKMSVSISPEDLVKVNVVNNSQEQKSSNVQLLVEFKSNHLKSKFLSNKQVLKNYPSTNSITIGNYVSDELHSLLMYAKIKLRNNGFNHIFYKNNHVMAKKHHSDPRCIRIINKAHVDSLQNNKNVESETTPPAKQNNKNVESETTPPAKPNECNIDENYYQL